MGLDIAYNRGSISHAQYEVLKKTRAQKSKMAKFNSRAGRNDQGGVRDRGEVPVNEINAQTNQAKTAPGVRKPVQMRGGKDRGGQPQRAHIDREQGPKFPAGGSSMRKSGAGANTRMKGKIIPTAGRGLMGDRNSRSNSTY